jgi:adenylosuccinate lyase
VVHEASLAALAEKRPLVDVLLGDAEVARNFTRSELQEALKPEGYIGLSGEVVDRIAGDIRRGLDAAAAKPL